MPPAAVSPSSLTCWPVALHEGKPLLNGQVQKPVDVVAADAPELFVHSITAKQCTRPSKSCCALGECVRGRPMLETFQKVGRQVGRQVGR